MIPQEYRILKALLVRRHWDTYGYLSEPLWTGTNQAAVYALMRDLFSKTAEDLTVPDLALYVTSSIRDEKRREELNEVLGAIEGSDPLTDDVLEAAVRRAVSRTLAIQAATEIVRGHNDPEFDPIGPYEVLGQSVETHSGSTTHLVTFAETGLPDLARDRPGLCSLRLSDRLDRALNGGIAAGELLVFLAGPKKGKTSILSIIGTRAALAGRKVLHATLELSLQLAARRYDSCLTGLGYMDLVANTHIIPGARRRIAEAGGEVTFIDWQCEEHSPSDLVPLVRRTGADLVIVDYLQLMVPDRTRAISRKEQRHLLSKVGKDIRGVAKKLGVPVITAWQVNREGEGADTVSKLDIAECWDTIQHADVVLGLSRGKEEIRNGTGRIHTLGVSRLSEYECTVDFNMNFTRNQIEEIEHGRTKYRMPEVSAPNTDAGTEVRAC